MKVLIANSNPTSRHLLSSTLVGMGHEIVFVAEQLQEISSLSPKGEAQILLLDCTVPGANCPAVLHELRQRCGPNIYIILLTQSDDAECITKELESELDDVLLTPVTEAGLRTHIRTGVRVLDLQKGHFETQRLLLNAAMCDDLTGLWNRRMILNQLAHELNRARRDQRPLAVAMMDIDLFKRVNDTFGHVAGDTVLRDVSASLRSQLRNYDFIGRYGGEEFLALLPGCDSETAADIARRMCQTVADTPIHIGEIEVPVTVSIGLSSTVDVGIEAAALIVAADDCLYRAKEGGRNRVFARRVHDLEIPGMFARSH